jgi:radical SAM protein with 4Fe4S-binding SPASM domain
VSADGVQASLPSARAMLARLSQELNLPLSAGIEISDRCNEVCVHCYQEQGRKGEMTTAELQRVMDELASMGVLLLTFSGGEATLRKDFLELVAYARRKGFAVRIFTNGLTMTRELARSLGELAVQTVEISLYSVHASTHDFVTGVPGSFDKTVAGVRHLIEAGVSVTLKTPLMTMNEGEVSDYAAFAASLGAAHAFDVGDLMPREGGSRAPEAFQVPARRRAELRRALSGATQLRRARLRDESPCTAAASLHIEANGELRPCTSLEVGLGNVLTDGVAAAHASNERALAIRKLTWANIHGCRECDLRSYCSRCYASALAQTGDALAPYPSACNSAWAHYEEDTGRTATLLRTAEESDVGPYREIAEGVFERLPDVITPDDDALAAQLGWVRRAGGRGAEPSGARPGELVQIRRPGRKNSALERIPAGARPNTSLAVAHGNDPDREPLERELTEA